jgi:ATP-dependent helicase HepA
VSSDRTFVPGQRWISITEPELGLGEVRTVDPRTIGIWFEGAGETRVYSSRGDIPLRRAAFHVGDTIATRSRSNAVIASVRERDGLFYYDLGGNEVCETDLSPRLGFNTPLRRMFAGQFDHSPLFEHRRAALLHQFAQRKSDVRGLVGARIDLLPHQLGIAAAVSNRLLPRVLLADEVGLGKTIEACLIVHRLLLTGRAQRVLILVPETLVHQWFLELLRRFNLWFHIFTEARCTAIEESTPGVNPFSDDQLVLCDLGLLTRNPERLEQALDATWDIVVVDEAHHLGWTPRAASPEYAAVERLGRAAPGLLLLTATPEQLGRTGHFARLRLLDPDRFHDLETFTREADDYQQVARLAGLLLDGRALTVPDHERLAAILDLQVIEVSDALADAGDQRGRMALFERLLDQHGTSRVMFRNTRATVTGFPRRIATLYPLHVSGSKPYAALADEWTEIAGTSTGGGPRSLSHDPRIPWLVSLLQSLGDDKVLLICRTPRTVRAIETALKERTTTKVASFHEELTLIQRDRGAAWFADPAGARLLLASEIGSEGRNFQFAHHLVLFDLPLDPGLLEQRLGRLDRIGQRADIHIHVPYVRASHLEVLARWYHEGLNAFEHHVPGAGELIDRFEPALRAMVDGVHRDRRTIDPELTHLLDETRRMRDDVAHRLEEGRDRLLEWNSARPALSRQIIEQIRDQDADRGLDEFMLLVFDLFFVQVEEIAPRTYRLGSAGVLVDEFPGLKAEGLTVTRDRERALVREDLQFLTWDHPLATGALDLLLGSEKGNCAFAHWVDAAASGLYLEASYVVECLAPPALHVDRFLPPTPVQALCDHRGQDIAPGQIPAGVGSPHPGIAKALVARADLRDRVLPRMIDHTRTTAEQLAAAIARQASSAMHAQLQHEIERLRDLQRVNRLVRDEEIAALERQEVALAEAIASARLRLDAVRLIYRGPER